jgi:hypothetical protein
MGTSPVTAASTRSRSSTPLHEKPLRGRLVDAAVAAGNPLAERTQGVREVQLIGVVDVSWTSPL